MKYLWLLCLTIILTACVGSRGETNSSAENQPSEVPASSELNGESLEETEPATELTLVGDRVLTLDRLTENAVIESPLFISGTVRRDWVNEASFPITLMSLENEVLEESYGTAAWLDPLPGDSVETMSGEDMIPFVAGMNFDTPAEGDRAKLRFTKADPRDEAPLFFVELTVSWPE